MIDAFPKILAGVATASAIALVVALVVVVRSKDVFINPNPFGPTIQQEVQQARAEVEADIVRRDGLLRAEIDRRFTLAVKEVEERILAVQPVDYSAKLAEAVRWQEAVAKRLEAGESLILKVEKAGVRAKDLVAVINILVKQESLQQTISAIDAALLSADATAKALWVGAKDGSNSLEALLWYLQSQVLEEMIR